MMKCDFYENTAIHIHSRVFIKTFCFGIFISILRKHFSMCVFPPKQTTIQKAKVWLCKCTDVNSRWRSSSIIHHSNLSSKLHSTPTLHYWHFSHSHMNKTHIHWHLCSSPKNQHILIISVCKYWSNTERNHHLPTFLLSSVTHIQDSC